MGTNFFFRYAECPTCHRAERVHVGKRSAGWSFTFRGYPHQPVDQDHPEWGYLSESPFGFPVLSRVDWLRVFTSHTGVLVDEYGEQEDDPLAWLERLVPPGAVCIQREPSWKYPAPGWRDAEGFHFLAQEFS